MNLVKKTISGAVTLSCLTFITVFFGAMPVSASTVQAALTSQGYYVNIKSDNVTINVSTTPNGTVAVGKDTLVTKTNVPSGYKLYVSMSSSADYDDTHPGNALYLGGDSTSSTMIPPTTGTISTPAALAKNSWGFNASYTSGTNGTAGSTSDVPDVFSFVPLKSNLALIQTTDSANEDPGVEKDIYYGVNASFGLPSGTYSNEVTYTAFAETAPSQDEGLTIVPSSTNSNDGGEEVMITTSLYTTYDLTKDDISVTIGGAVCTIADNSKITINEDTKTVSVKCTTPAGAGASDVVLSIPSYDKTYTLTGGYTYPSRASFWNITYMQEMTPSVCESATTPLNTAGKTEEYIDTTGAHQGDENYVAQRILYDIRDNKSYTVRKLADGNCWMTDNLQYELVPEKTAIGSKNDGSTFEWKPVGGCGGSGACAMNGNTLAYTTTNAATGEVETNWYYSWYAATAGIGTSNDASKDIDGSICPAHWKLPYNYAGTGGQADKSYGGLIAAYDISASNHNSSTEYKILDALPLSFARVGYIYGTISESTTGSFQPSTAYSNSTYAYNFYYGQSSVNPQNNRLKHRGSSVRCVAL